MEMTLHIDTELYVVLVFILFKVFFSNTFTMIGVSKHSPEFDLC